MGGALMRPQFLVLTFLVSMLPFGAAFAHGAYHELLDALTREIEQKPEDAALYFKRARLHVSHEEWKAALIDLERVDRLNPEKILTDGLRGQALNQGHHWAAALTVLNAHLRVSPEDMDALFERGRARAHLGDAGAAEDYRTSLASAEMPAAERVLEAVGAVKAHDGAKDAAVFIEKIIADHGGEPSVVERAMNLALECGELDVALRHLESLQRQAPRPEPWMARRARALSQAGREADAKAAWMSLHDHLLALPNLERGIPLLNQLLADAQKALGIAPPAPVIAPPAFVPSPNPVPHLSHTP